FLLLVPFIQRCPIAICGRAHSQFLSTWVWQLPNRAVEARERLRARVALVETFVHDDAERLDQSEAFGIGRAQTGGIVGALGPIGPFDQNPYAPGQPLPFL